MKNNASNKQNTPNEEALAATLQSMQNICGAVTFVKATSDPVNHPAHYTSSPSKCSCGKQIECIQITEHMSFTLGNAVKYIWRSSLKNGLEDLKKAAWYINRAIETQEKEGKK